MLTDDQMLPSVCCTGSRHVPFQQAHTTGHACSHSSTVDSQMRSSQHVKHSARTSRSSTGENKADLSHNVVGGRVISDEAGQDDGGRVLQAGVCLLDGTHQGLQIRVLLQQHRNHLNRCTA